MFRTLNPFPGIGHIEDAMGVCMTLLTGSGRALLFDTGYGLENVKTGIGRITSLPLTVLLSHGHHDHAMGALWFPSVQIAEKDLPVFRKYTSEPWRLHVLRQAEAKGLSGPTDYSTRPVAEAHVLDWEESDLGGLTVQALQLPGHTPGSVMLLVREHGCLITGDNWNPETWCFFPEAEPVQILRRSLQTVLTLDFHHVLCSHQHRLFERAKLEQFVEALTDENLRNALPTDHGKAYGVDSRVLEIPGGQRLVFDYAKFLAHA